LEVKWPPLPDRSRGKQKAAPTVFLGTISENLNVGFKHAMSVEILRPANGAGLRMTGFCYRPLNKEHAGHAGRQSGELLRNAE